jgi:hypothetical protein
MLSLMSIAPMQRVLFRQRNVRDVTQANTFGKLTIYGVAIVVNKRHFSMPHRSTIAKRK